MTSINNMKAMLNRDTKKYLRIHGTEEWRKQCLKKANYRCNITGKEGCKKCPLDVHHKNVSFNSIMKKAHKKLNVQFHKLTIDYIAEDLAALVDLIKEMHKDVEGVVIKHTLHMAFHEYYGGKATADDYKEFRKLHKSRQYKAKNGSHRKAA